MTMDGAPGFPTGVCDAMLAMRLAMRDFFKDAKAFVGLSLALPLYLWRRA